MSRIFLGKISKNYPQQFDENFYAAGKKDSSWYGGIEVGDYVFPIFDSSVKKLWRVASFSEEPNPVNPEGMVKFDLVKEYKEPVMITTGFAKYRHFQLDLNLLNKLTKSTASEKLGFYEIHCDDQCPPADKIDFSDIRNIYITSEYSLNPVNWKENDIRILINGRDQMKINNIQIYQQGDFVTYTELNNLYKQKNRNDQLYSLQELLDYAKTDGATKKEKYLSAVIDELLSHGYFTVPSPIGLYDNLLVGRKRTPSAKKAGGHEAANTENNDDDDSQEDSLTKEETESYKEYVDLLKFSPNLILYGPPGTGKTHAAQKIIEAFEFDRTKEERSFRDIQQAGKVSFVTFHQSFSYEEFVEGLRPVISNSDTAINEGSENLTYKVQPGILLNIANNSARSQVTTEAKENEFAKVKDENRIWKISLGERGKEESLYPYCIKNNCIAIGWFDDENIGKWDYNAIYKELSADKKEGDPNPTNNANSINNFVNELQEGDLVLVFANQTSIRAIGMVDGPYEWKKEEKQYTHRRKVKWLKVFDKPVDIRKYNGGKMLSQVTLYELSMKFLDIKELLDNEKAIKKEDQKRAEPYFLIIDEINRGNISKIFGELITLIERDKRDKIKVRLPYSQKEFSLPSNLFIIGTMNTADRSIAVLDTALRRRFNFKEVEPDVTVIKKENPVVDNLDLTRLFEKLNAKITEKLDRDHRLGHSYFLDINRIKDFKIVWYYQVIPLLMEYFYNDPDSIASVITEAFIDKKTGQVTMIESEDAFKAALLNIK